MSGQDNSDPRRGARFATTQWSVVLAAGHRSSAGSDRALESLCQTYWYPLYAYVRRRGYPPEDAADLTQEFFARLLEKEYLKSADPERGRFRAYLLTIFKRFLSKEYQRRQAQKRGGALRRLALDFDAGERRYCHEPSHDWTAERLFERRWALTLLDRVVQQLQEQYEAKGKDQLFDRCKVYLAGPPAAPPYSEVADLLGMPVGAVRVAVHRMRQRYRQLLRAEVAQTLGEEAAIDDELEVLRRALRGENDVGL